jgi:hypothetical protein
MKLICFACCLVVLESATLLAQVPLINQPLVPVSARPGSKGFVLKVSGTGFSRQAVIEWNGSKRVTEFSSSSHLRTTISSSDVAKARTAWVRVVRPCSLWRGILSHPPPVVVLHLHAKAGLS